MLFRSTDNNPIIVLSNVVNTDVITVGKKIIKTGFMCLKSLSSLNLTNFMRFLKPNHVNKFGTNIESERHRAYIQTSLSFLTNTKTQTSKATLIIIVLIAIVLKFSSPY